MGYNMEKENENNSNVELENGNTSSESEQLDYDKLNERLDSLLNDAEESKITQEKLETLIEKQNKIIELQQNQIKELKKVNLDLANNSNSQQISIEEALVKNFANR